MLIKGKWMWNNEIWDKDENGGFQSQCEFVSNGQVFTDLGFGYNSRWDYYTLDYLGKNTGSMQVAASAQGDTTLRLELEEYRIMDFGEAGCEISMDAYDFIVANAEPFYDIADKLSRIWDNVILVHNAGRKSGYDAGNQAGYTQGYSNGKQDGYFEGEQAGKQAEYDAFWDAYQLNGNRGVYEAAFAGQGWNDKSFNPKYPIVVTGSSWNMFYSCNVKDGYEILKNMDFSKCTLLGSTFAQCHMKHLGTIDCRNVKSVSNLFYHARNLQTIDKIIVDVDNTFSSPFDNTLSLENVTFEGEIGNNLVMAGTYSGTKWGEKLTRASIESIIKHLSDTASGKTLTLSEAAVDKAFETEDLFGSETDEWATLYSSKPNWKITLV